MYVIHFTLIHHPLRFQNGRAFEDFEERFAAATPVSARMAQPGYRCRVIVPSLISCS